MTNTRVHVIWRNMIYRCESKSSPLFRRYGAKGIVVCRRWKKFENFFADMGNPPTSRHSIDRVNGKKGYTKTNCRWATPTEQASNLKSNRNLTLNGETRNVRSWARELRISRCTINGRLKAGWTVEAALTKAIQAKQRH